MCDFLLEGKIREFLLEDLGFGDITTELLINKNISINSHVLTLASNTFRENFFEKYATHGKAGGTGLGNYSARLIAETQNGSIDMQSSEIDGTSVIVQLPQVTND